MVGVLEPRSGPRGEVDRRDRRDMSSNDLAAGPDSIRLGNPECSASL